MNHSTGKGWCQMEVNHDIVSDKTQLRTFSYGGGVQSTAALVLAANKKIDYPIFLFCNVGEDSENPDTIKYFYEYAAPYAEENKIQLHMLHRKNEIGEVETLYGKITKEGSRSIPIPVRMSNGAPGKRSCTVDFKIRVVSKWLKTNGATKKNRAITGLGISLDEIERARTDSGIQHQIIEYPLLDLGLTRRDCVKIIQESGLPVPPKSSCYFCPFHNDHVWQDMKRNNIELFEKSVALEKLINDRKKILGKAQVFLHRSCVPLDRAIGDQMPLFADDFCESGYCLT